MYLICCREGLIPATELSYLFHWRTYSLENEVIYPVKAEIFCNVELCYAFVNTGGLWHDDPKTPILTTLHHQVFIKLSRW